MQRFIFIFFAFYTGVCTNGQTHADFRLNSNQFSTKVRHIKRILILGDSHLLGAWGEMLHRNLHNNGNFDILSIAIGGAGSYHFTRNMRNNCCGFAIRESFFNEKLNNKPIRKIEYSNTISGEIVGKKFGGRLENVCQQFEPDIIIIALGHNYINDHQNLINILKKHNENVTIIWLSPLNNKRIQQQLAEIQKVVKKNNLFLIRSDDIVGNANAACEHIWGTPAQNWADTITKRLLLILENLKNNFNAKLYNDKIIEPIPVFKNYYENLIFMKVVNNQMNIFDIAVGNITQTAPSFHHVYLNRSYFNFLNQENETQTIYDVCGNSYTTVKIGNSVWMSENLKCNKYRDGTYIHQLQTQYASKNEIPYFYIKNHSYYYSWYAVNHSKGLCPYGWHIPDISEWTYFAKNFSHEIINQIQPINNNQLQEIQYFWTINIADSNSKNAWAAGIDQEQNEIIFVNRKKSMAFPVRCVKD